MKRSFAREFATDLINRLDRIRCFAAEQFLDIDNNAWRDGNEPKLTATELAAQLQNPSIVLYDE